MSPPGGFDDLGDLAPPPAPRPWKAIAAAVVVVVVIAVVAVVVLSSSSGTSLASYRTKADGVCSSLAPQIESAVNNFKQAESEDNTSAENSSFQTAFELGHEEVGKLEALPQPSQDSGLIKQLYSTETQYLNDYENGLEQSNSQLVQQAATENNNAEQLASQIGLTTCAAISSSSSGG